MTFLRDFLSKKTSVCTPELTVYGLTGFGTNIREKKIGPRFFLQHHDGKFVPLFTKLFYSPFTTYSGVGESGFSPPKKGRYKKLKSTIAREIDDLTSEYNPVNNYVPTVPLTKAIFHIY